MVLYRKKTYISDPIEIQTLRIGNFAAQIGNDPKGLIPGIKAEGDHRKILCLVVESNCFLGGLGKFQKLKQTLLWHFCAYLFNIFDIRCHFARQITF